MLVVQGDPESFRLAAKAATDGQPAALSTADIRDKHNTAVIKVASIELQAYGEEHYLDLRRAINASNVLAGCRFRQEQD